jgi:hypothetical protein
MNAKETAFTLANRAINTPTLLTQLNEETYLLFVIGVAKYHKELATKLENIRPLVSPQNKILFWETVGIIVPMENYN